MDRLYNFPVLVLLLVSLTVVYCKEVPTQNGSDDKPTEPAQPVTFEPIEETVPEGNQDPGFFMESWKEKQIPAPDSQEKSKPTEQLNSRIQVNTENEIAKVSPAIFGNNINPYIGRIHQENILIDHMKSLNPRVIRMPGGNLSNVFFWDAGPGALPPGIPDSLVDGNTGDKNEFTPWYGKDSWSLGLDEFYEFIEKTGSTPVISVNIGYARYGTSRNPIAQAAHYAAEWVRYDNGRTRYWELGNENYGTWQAGYQIDTSTNQDGQPEIINGKLYADIVDVFVDSMRAVADEIGVDIKIGAQLIEREVTESWETDVVRNWNEGYFSAIRADVDYYVVHNYYTPYEQDSPPSVILNSAHTVTRDMMVWMNKTIRKNGAEMKPIALTEWNIFAAGSRQMVSDISGMHAAMVLGELIKYKYGMANRWNIANGWSDGNDHGMFNRGDEPGGVTKWNPRPDFFHMYYFQRFFGDRMVWSGTQGDDKLVSYASTFSSGQVGLVVANTGDAQLTFDVEFKNFSPGARYYWYTLEGGDEGTFSRKVLINGKGPDVAAGGPDDYKNIKAFSAKTSGEEGIKLSAPGHSVIYILVDGQ